MSQWETGCEDAIVAGFSGGLSADLEYGGNGKHRRVKRRARRHAAIEYGAGPGDILGSILSIAAPLAGTALGGPLGGMLGGAAGDLLGGLLGGGGGKGAPAATEQQIAQMAPGQAATAARTLAGALPEEVRQVVRDELNRGKSESASASDMVENIKNAVGSAYGPQLAAITQLTQQAALSRAATNEHRFREQDDTRWRELNAAQTSMLQKLEAIEARLSNSRVLSSRVADIFSVPRNAR